MAESSNAEGSKPTTVEDLIQLLTTQQQQQQRFQHKIMLETLETQQRSQQEKFFEMMSTFSTALQASVPIRQQQEAALPQTTPKFEAFDSTTELWTDYWSRFSTFTKANSVPDVRVAEVFLTNQTATIYKLLSTLASQETSPRTVNDLTMNEIQQYMMNQFHPKRFVVRERFRYWSDMKRSPGETVQELAARIRQAAATCDFANIENSLDKALRTRFICSINNEAVLKALFKINVDELNFEKAIQVATETEEAAMVAKETVHGTSSNVYSSTVAQVSKKQNFVKNLQRTLLQSRTMHASVTDVIILII